MNKIMKSLDIRTQFLLLVSISHIHNSLCFTLQALEVAQKYYGAESKELIPIYQSLARAEGSHGDTASRERASKLLMQAHDISKSK